VPTLMQLKEGRFATSDNWQVTGEGTSDSCEVTGEATGVKEPFSLFPPMSPDTCHFSRNSLHFPLAFQNQTCAEWQVDVHRNGEDFTESDRRILATIAHQAETAVGNVILVERLRGQLAEIHASRETLAHAQRQLLRSREDERTRLARDLHDGPLQNLVNLNMQLGLLLLEGPSPITGALDAMRGDVRGLLKELRQVCAELRPPMLDTMGLGAAIRVLAEEWSLQNNLPVRMDLVPDSSWRTLPSEVAVNLYRLIQEALTNIARHAAAKTVEIGSIWQDARLIVTIRDDGRGFQVPSTLHDLAAQGHFGLVGMQERAALVGATLTVESVQDKGTCVRIVWSRRS
jgi:signal transduction histidine kinase